MAHARSLWCAILMASAAGCVSTEARIPREEVAALDSRKGTVYGSIRVLVDPSVEDTSFRFAPGRKTANMSHRLSINCFGELARSLVDAPDAVQISLTLGEELVVVQKLPAGECGFFLDARGGVLLEGTFPLGVIPIEAGTPTYFGAVEVALPTAIALGSLPRATVSDQKSRALETLRPEYGDLLEDAAFWPVECPRRVKGDCTFRTKDQSPTPAPIAP